MKTSIFLCILKDRKEKEKKRSYLTRRIEILWIFSIIRKLWKKKNEEPKEREREKRNKRKKKKKILYLNKIKVNEFFITKTLKKKKTMKSEKEPNNKIKRKITDTTFLIGEMLSLRESSWKSHEERKES